MLEDFIADCAFQSMQAGLLMTATVTIRGRSVSCVRNTTDRRGRFEEGGLASIGNCYLQALTAEIKSASPDPTDLLGDLVTMDGVAWRVFGVETGDAVTQLTVQRDTEAE